MLLKIKRVRWQVLVLLVLFFSVIFGIIVGSATANSVSTSYASESSHTLTANQLKPAECNGINISNIVNLSQGEVPTSGNDLILGTANRDIVDGGDGDDCIVGGGANDKGNIGSIKAGLSGGDGNDVILGGAGNDRLIGGAGTDTCHGGAGNDQMTCEIEYP